MAESSGWELHKENIQPLSSGRNISLLKHALDTSKSIADHENDVETQVSELESNIQHYAGDDPIEPYLALIRFLEQQCTQTMAWKKSLANARMECYKKFYDNPKYHNDKRYVEAIVKCLNEAVPDSSSRVNLLLVALKKKGIGKNVSQMYIVIADHQESMGKANEALHTLKSGIENNAQPMDKLQETILELEFRIARDLAKLMNEGRSVESRNFASSVPVYGVKNDAPVFRNDLKPAVPVFDRQSSGHDFKLQKQKSESHIPLFRNECENEPITTSSSVSRSVGFNLVENVLEAKSDKENKLRPSKWNKPDVVVEPEPRSYEAPREKISIFTEEITETIGNTQSLRSVIQDGILKERKRDAESCSQGLDNVLSAPVSDRSTALTSGRQNNQTATQLSTINGISTTDIEMAPTIIPNARLMCNRTMLPNGKPASFEHRQRQAWQRKNQDKELIAQLKRDNAHLESKLLKAEGNLEQLREVEESLRENFETELKQKAIKESHWEQQRYSYNDTIVRLTTECSALKEQIQQLKLHQKEAEATIEELHSRHRQEVDDINATHLARIEQLTMQLEIAQRQRQGQPVTLANASINSTTYNSGSTQPSGTSNQNECTFIKSEQQNSKLSQSQSMALRTDKLLNATGMSYMDSFMAPPSRLAQISGGPEIDDSVNPEPEPSFNASVRMTGATTVYGWRDDNKTRFCFNSSDVGDSSVTRDIESNKDATGNDTAPDPAFTPMMLPPPPSVSKKFVLYESISDSRSMSRGKKPEPYRQQGADFRTLSENVAPLPPPTSNRLIGQGVNLAPVTVARIPSNIGTSVSARIAEIEAISSYGTDVNDDTRPTREIGHENKFPGTVGQTFTRPVAFTPAPTLRTKMEKALDDDDEPPFEPYIPSSSIKAPSSRRCETYQPPELPFDTSNLTSALQFGPPPLLNSTPQRSTVSGGIRRINSDLLYSGNYVHTQYIPRLSEVVGEIEGPMSPYNEETRDRDDNMAWMQDRARRLAEFHHHNPPTHDVNESMQMQLNLSPIQETSKENRSSCTTGSSSGNMTSTRGGGTMSGVSMFNSNSRSVSGVPRSASSSTSRSYRYTTQNQN